MAVTFSSLSIRNWRQFRYVKIDVHPRATIITGANGAGKSTILGIFGQHLGYQRQLVGTPARKVGGGWIYETGYFDVIDDESKQDEPFLPFTVPPRPSGMPPGMPFPSPISGDVKELGRLAYTNDVVAALIVPKTGNAYGISIQPQQHVPGIYMSSHRIIAPYQQVSNLSLQVAEASSLYANYVNELNARFNGQQTSYSPLYRLKEAILSLAAFGQGNDYLEGSPALLELTNEFEAALRITLPDELGFKTFSVRMPDIVLSTTSGEFTLDASSGGIGAIFELTWQLLLFSKTQAQDENFVVVMDEPENHLHPSMQRTLLPKLLKAFPKIQFIVATHSPFVVSSVEDSNVYALRYQPVTLTAQSAAAKSANRVVAVRLNQFAKAGSASDILREVLGVPATFPDWANDRVDRIVEELAGIKVDKDAIAALRTRLIAAGLEEYFPQALESLVSVQ